MFAEVFFGGAEDGNGAHRELSLGVVGLGQMASVTRLDRSLFDCVVSSESACERWKVDHSRRTVTRTISRFINQTKDLTMNTCARALIAGTAALAFSITATQAAIITVDVHPASAAEISDDPTLADATIVDLLVDSEADLLLSFDVDLTTVGTLYNHVLESADDGPPNPAVVATFPALGADSHIAFGERLGGNLASPSGDFPLSVAGPLPAVAHNGLAARITVLNDADATIEGTVYISTDGVNSIAIAYTTPTGITGDLDGDGFVGITDLNLVLSNWNMTIPPGDDRADPNGDDFVGIEDLNVVLANWNAGTPPVAAVPEPATLALLGLGGLAVLRRR